MQQKDGSQATLTAVVSSLRHGLSRLEAAVDSLDLSLCNALDSLLDPGLPFISASAPERKPSPPPKPPKSQTQLQQKSLFESLKQILIKIPSPYQNVESIYDEIRAFVCICMIQISDITPTSILNDNLFPYLIAAHRLQPSLRDQIWLQMKYITGCTEPDIKRVFKRMIDNHHRGFKRKPPSIDSVPISMRPLMRVIGADRHDNCLNLLDADNDLDLTLRLKRPRLSPSFPLI